MPPARSALLALFWIAAVVCAISQLVLIRAVVSGRASPATTSGSARWREIAWVVIPALALLAVLVATWRTLHGTDGIVTRFMS